MASNNAPEKQTLTAISIMMNCSVRRTNAATIIGTGQPHAMAAINLDGESNDLLARVANI